MGKLISLKGLGKGAGGPRIYSETEAHDLVIPANRDETAFLYARRRIKIVIGMLMPDTLIDFSVMSCVEAMMNAMASYKYKDGTHGYLVNFKQMRTSNIFVGRNQLAEYALHHNADFLLFVDSDMVFNPDAAHNLICHGKDIVSGLAFKKAPPFDCVMGMKKHPEDKFSKVYPVRNWVDGALIKVDSVGTAFMLINMDVFRKMERPWFFHEDMGNNSILGSDHYFCQKAGQSGFEVWVDTAEKIGHVGTKAYGFDDHIACGGLVKPKAETDDPSTEFDYGPPKKAAVNE